MEKALQPLDQVDLEQALRESEIKFRTLTESAAVGIFLYREKFIYVNPAMERITGYPLEELRELYLWDVVHEDHKELVKQRIRDRLAGKNPPAHYEVKIVTKSGEERWLEVTAAVFKMRGQTVGVGTAVDITKKKELYHSLQEIIAKYEAILEAFDGYVCVVSSDYRVQFMNKNLIRRLGREAIGEICYQLFHNLSEPCPWCKKDQVFAGKPAHLEIQCPRDGRWYQVVSTPLKLPSGEIQSLTMVVDITDRKKAEEEALHASKLEALGLLAGGIAHDFNNFLTAILGNISLARLKIEGHAELERLLSVAEEACLKAKGLTYQLLTFAKGGTPIKKPASVGDLVRETVSFCLRGSNIKWAIHIDPNLWLVDLDTTQFSQVITNLVINAKQAMPDGGQLQVSVRNLKIDAENPFLIPPGRYVEIVVSDTGIGIPKEYLSKIFDPYFTTKKEGTGLGLAVSYSIIKKHGGHIRVKSQEGKGTTFYIYLPALEEKGARGKRSQGKVVTGRGRILVMDDEKIIRSTFRESLEFLGYEVVTVAHGEAAVQEVAKSIMMKQPFDLAILDLTIPGGAGGKEVLREIRQLDPEIKAIVASGYADDPAFEDYRLFGFQAAIKKPFTIQELSAVLQKVLKHEPPEKVSWR